MRSNIFGAVSYPYQNVESQFSQREWAEQSVTTAF